jgi:hypothetical protein
MKTIVCYKSADPGLYPAAPTCPSIVSPSQRVGDLAWSVDVSVSIRTTGRCRDTL